MIMAVIVCSLSRAAALNCTGELTVALLPGEHIFTVLSVVAVHVWAEARPVAKTHTRQSRAAEDK